MSDIYTATCGSFLSIGHNQCPPLLARDYKQPNIVCYKNGGTKDDNV